MVKLKKGYIKEWLGFVGTRWYFWGIYLLFVLTAGYTTNFSLTTTQPFYQTIGNVVSWFFFAAMIPTAIWLKGNNGKTTPKWMYR